MSILYSFGARWSIAFQEYYENGSWNQFSGMIERKVVAFECGETGKWRWAAERSGVA